MFATLLTTSIEQLLSTPRYSVSSSRCIRRRASQACREATCNCCSTDPVPAGPVKPCRMVRVPAPGGWNRIQIEVDDLEATVNKLRNAHGRLRNAIVTGNGGKQILIEDPSGNPIELFQPIADAESTHFSRGGFPGKTL